LSVPYALHAKTAANTFSGNYSDLTGIPSNVSTFTNDAGYLTSITETDPVFGAHAANGITSTNITNWTTAFGWGNHSTAGYITSFTESDPIFVAHPSNGITSVNITNWTTAYGWGNHSTPGYITDGNTGWDNSYGFITASSSETLTNKSGNISMWTNDAGYLTDYTETDPVFSNLFSITSPADNQLLKYNSGTSKWENWTPNFLTTEVDGDVTNEIQDLSLSINTLSLTGDATSVDLSGYLDNTDAQDLSLNSNTLSLTNDATTVDLSGYLDNTDNQNLSNVLSHGTDAGNNAIVNISQQGIGTGNPNVSAALEISSTTQGFLPPRMTDVEMNAISPVAGLQVYNTTINLPLFYNGSEWLKLDGSLYIGKSYAGGIIFYVDNTGEHGYVCAENDQSTGAEWGCVGTDIPGANGTAVGTGVQNTIDIEAGCTTTGTAADICANLSLNSYSDWFLPSKDELNLMYTNLYLKGFGGFTSTRYWSSSEGDPWNSRLLDFSTGGNHVDQKDWTRYVRAARAF